MKTVLIVAALLLLPVSLRAGCDRGDIDGNGVVNLSDAIMFLGFWLGEVECIAPCGGCCTADEADVCPELDVNQDNDFCAGDVFDLLRYIFGGIELDLGCDGG